MNTLQVLAIACYNALLLNHDGLRAHDSLCFPCIDYKTVLPDEAEAAQEANERAQLLAQCKVVCKQVKAAPAYKDLMQRRRPLQAQFDAAVAAAEDFVLVGTLGMQLQELEKESAQLSLSEEDYLTLADRHTALVQRVTEQCRAQKAASQFTELEKLATQLVALTALDVSELPGACVGTKPSH
jgi:hypothetical protein